MNTTTENTETKKAPCGAEWHGLRAGLPDCGCGWGGLCTEDVERHAVFATDGEHKVYRVSDPMTWNDAQTEWARLSDLRSDGRLPHVKHFEVRAVTLGPNRPIVGPEVHSHGKYDGAPLSFKMTRPVVKGSKGFSDDKWFPGRRSFERTGAEKAARAAWKLHFPTFRSWYDKRVNNRPGTGVQGTGGWYYYSNGVTAAQGLNELAVICQRKDMIVQGKDGKWYVFELEVLS